MTARGTKPPGGVLLADGAPPAMIDEVRAEVRRWGKLQEVAPPPSGLLADACPADGSGYVVLRPALLRSYFASNAGDRNALIIYESAIVVGLPVAAISLVAWPWYGETTVEGALDSVRCASGGPPGRVVASTRIRSEGRGIVRTATIQNAQADAAVRGVVRKLLALRAAEAEAVGEQGEVR